jgi:hypothetical protein
MALLQREEPSIMSNSTEGSHQSIKKEETLLSYMTNRRSRKQLSIFVAGATLLTFSTIITRRSLLARRKATYPSFWRQSNAPLKQSFSGAMEAFQALQLASLNVGSSMLMVTGGLLWAFDISSIEELRRKIRGGLGVDGSGRGESAVEEEFEEWMAKTLDRRRQKDEKLKKEGKDVQDEDEDGLRTINERGKRR